MLQFFPITNTATPEPVSSGIALPSMIVFIAVLAAFVIAGFVFAAILRSVRMRESDGLNRKKIRETWNEIEKTSGMGLMGAKLSVIEADKLLDTVLRDMHIPGETMGERLKMAAYRYKSISDVWPAHKLRNQLVHDSTFELSIGQAKRAVRDFERALKHLGAL